MGDSHIAYTRVPSEQDFYGCLIYLLLLTIMQETASIAIPSSLIAKLKNGEGAKMAIICHLLLLYFAYRTRYKIICILHIYTCFVYFAWFNEVKLARVTILRPVSGYTNWEIPLYLPC